MINISWQLFAGRQMTGKMIIFPNSQTPTEFPGE